MDRLPAERKRALIIAAGEALWGSRWQADMARAVSVHEDTVNAWKRGLKSPRDTVFDTLRARIVERRDELGFLLDELDRSTRPGKPFMFKKIIAALQGKMTEAAVPPGSFTFPSEGSVVSFATSRQPMTELFAAHLLAPDAKASVPAIVFDRNAVLLSRTCKHRETLGRTVYRVTPLGSGDSINLLTALVRGGEHLERDAKEVARLLVTEHADLEEMTRAVVATAIIHLYETKAQRTFAGVYHWLAEIASHLIGEPSKIGAYDVSTLGSAGLVTGGLAELREIHPAHLVEVLKHALSSLEWVADCSPAPIVVQERSDVDLRDVLSGDADLFVTYSPAEQAILAPWLRIFAAAPVILTNRTDARTRVQIIVDEADQIGIATNILDAFRFGPMSEVQYWMRAFKPTTFKRACPHADAILANASAVTFFGGAGNGPEDAGELSRLCGTRAVHVKGYAGPTLHPALSPYEIRSLTSGDLVVVQRGTDGPKVLRGYVADADKAASAA